MSSSEEGVPTPYKCWHCWLFKLDCIVTKPNGTCNNCRKHCSPGGRVSHYLDPEHAAIYIGLRRRSFALHDGPGIPPPVNEQAQKFLIEFGGSKKRALKVLRREVWIGPKSRDVASTMAFTDWQQNFKDNPGRIEQVPHFKLYPKSTGHTEKSARPPPRLATLLFEREYAVAEAGYSSLVANDGSVFTVVPRDAVDGSVLRVEHTTNIFSSPSSSHESGSRRKRKKSRQLHRAPSTTPEAPHLPDDDLALHVTPSEQPQLEDDAQSSSSSCDTKPSGTLLVSQPLPSRRTRQCPRSMAAARPAQARDGESVSGIVKEEATNVDTNESSKRQRLCPSTAAASARHGAANMESSQAEASSAAPSTQRSRLCPRSRAPTASMYGSTTTSYTSKHEDEDSKAFVGGSLPDGGSLLDNGTLLTGCSPPDGGTVLATRAGAPAAASRTQPLAQAGVGALSSHSSTVSAKGPLGEGGGGGGGGGNSAALASDSAFVAGCPWTTTAARAAVRLSQQENHS